MEEIRIFNRNVLSESKFFGSEKDFFQRLYYKDIRDIYIKSFDKSGGELTYNAIACGPKTAYIIESLDGFSYYDKPIEGCAAVINRIGRLRNRLDFYEDFSLDEDMIYVGRLDDSFSDFIETAEKIKLMDDYDKSVWREV